jgi:hypothetical protein
MILLYFLNSVPGRPWWGEVDLPMLLHTSPQLANDVVGSFWPGRVQKIIVTELRIRQSWENNSNKKY